MSDNKNHIKTFTAEDIRNYWSGKMSPREMHALEKASLDDPFLADALEGYASVDKQTADSDIEWLHKNLNKTDDGTKAVPLFRQSWMRVAAAVIIVAGLGTLSYLLFSPAKKNEVAQAKNSVQKKENNESKQEKIAPVTKDSVPANNFNVTENKQVDEVKANSATGLAANSKSKKQQPAPAAFQFRTQVPVASTESLYSPAVNDSVKLAKTFSDTEDLKKEKATAVEQTLSEKVSGVNIANEEPRVATQNLGTQRNAIVGKITNNKNEPIAGAVIKANNFNNVTMSDKNGYFSLPVPDSTKYESASVSSLGFVGANVALNAYTQNNIKLEENNAALNDVVVVGYGSKKKKEAYKRAAAVSQVDTLQPAPVDGWEDYYSYVQRNTQAFDNIDGEIVVRFDVDKKGKPNNIVVEKSLSDAADKEAIRIIKEGPDWKPNSKKKKVRLTIKF